MLHDDARDSVRQPHDCTAVKMRPLEQSAEQALGVAMAAVIAVAVAVEVAISIVIHAGLLLRPQAQ